MTDIWGALTMGAPRPPHPLATAPTTRSRLVPSGAPTGPDAERHARRASNAPVTGEGTGSPDAGRGPLLAPGVRTDKHVAGWRAETDAVHAGGGRIVNPLLRTGRIPGGDARGCADYPAPEGRSVA